MRESAAVCQPLIRDLPADERPRERLRLRGPGALSNAELLAILLRTGSMGENVLALAGRLLSRFEGLGGLGQASLGELCGVKSVGEAKAAQVLAALELGKRIISTQPDQRTTIRSSDDVFALLFADMALLPQEHLKVVLLNTRNQVVSVQDVYKGNVNSAVVRVGEVFRAAVREGCPSIIVVHNHPSGDPAPSAEDAALTKQLVEAGRMLGIELLDHVVIARGGHRSLKDLGLGFPPGPPAARP
ncbi:MAG: DNA repair protein RadC [Dehalococcoidia bacterium]|nr:DNA repair protein RadC [Dehalococcoidia bacterium]